MESKVLSIIRALILDMDGVLWRDNDPIGNLPTLFDLLTQMGIRFVLATNNSTRTSQQYLEKIAGFGVHLQPWQIITSSQATARLLQERLPRGSSVFVIGEPALVATLKEAGYPYGETSAEAVIAGLDRSFTYQKLRLASHFIRQGKPFIGTNPDRTLPTPEGFIPGAGSILAAIEAATDVKPEIAGKPSPRMYQIALERLAVPAEQTLVIGDRPETDITGGQQLGCRTALVLSGVTNSSQAQAWKPAPDFIFDDFSHTVNQLWRSRQG